MNDITPWNPEYRHLKHKHIHFQSQALSYANNTITRKRERHTQTHTHNTTITNIYSSNSVTGNTISLSSMKATYK